MVCMKCVGRNAILPGGPITEFMVCVEVHVRLRCGIWNRIHGYRVRHIFKQEHNLAFTECILYYHLISAMARVREKKHVWLT